MFAAAREVFVLYIKCLQRSEIFLSQPGELVQKLIERLALTLFKLRKTVEGIEGPRFSVLQDDSQAWHPVGAFPVDEVAHDVKRAPRVFSIFTASFVAVHPDV